MERTPITKRGFVPVAVVFSALVLALLVLCGPATSATSTDGHPSDPFSGEAVIQRLVPSVSASAAGDPIRSRARLLVLTAAFVAVGLVGQQMLTRRAAAARHVPNGHRLWARQLPLRAPPRLASLPI